MRVFLLFFSVAMLWGGSQALYTALTNLQATELTIEQYEKSPSDKKWLRVKDGYVDLTDAVTSSFMGVGEIGEIYLAVRRKDALPSEPVSVVLATKNSALLKIVNEMNDLESDDEITSFLLKNHATLFQQRNADGLVRFGIELDDSDERDLRELIPTLTEDFIVIDEGGRPDWVMIIMLPMGLVAGFAFFKTAGKKKGPPPVPPIPPTAPTGERRGPPPVPQ